MHQHILFFFLSFSSLSFYDRERFKDCKRFAAAASESVLRPTNKEKGLLPK
jgi:hypothetical protein